MGKFWRVLCSFLLLIQSLWFYGCNDSTVDNVSGVTNLSTLSVVQGVVYGNSVRASVSATSSQATSGGFVSMDLALKSDSGLILQRKSFASRSSDGAYTFSFEGSFPKEPLRLVIFHRDQALEIALGTLSQSALEVEIADFEAYALATRWLEQTKEYRELRSKSFADLQARLEDLQDAIGGESADLLLNYHRLGVDASGRLAIMPTTYDPTLYRAPRSAPAWEAQLTDPEFLLKRPQSIPSQPVQTASTEPAQVITSVPTVPIPARTNVLEAAGILEGVTEVLVYRPWSSGASQSHQASIRQFKIRLKLNRDIDEEMQLDLLTKGKLQIHQKGQLVEIPLAGLSQDVSRREITFVIKPWDWNMDYGSLNMVLYQELGRTAARGLEYLFFRANLELI